MTDTTNDEQEIKALNTVSARATRSEKISWDRKMDTMVSLMAKIRPIEDSLLDLMATKQQIFDEITELRKIMVLNCVHPLSHLVYKGNNIVECKFCNRQFKPVDIEKP